MSTPEQQDSDLLLALIPTDRLKPQQKAKWRKGTTWPTYRLLREPKDVDEFKSYRPGVAIWRDNGTLSYVSRNGGASLGETKKSISFGLCSELTCTIAGENDQAIMETAQFFCNLKYPVDSRHQLAIGNPNGEQPAGAFDLDHDMQLCGLTLNKTQSVALATRPYPVNLVLLNSMRFEDGGCAFVDALQSRESSFGTLRFSRYADTKVEWGQMSCLDGTALQRLFQTKTIEKLEIWSSLDINVLPHLVSSSIESVYWRYGDDQEIDIQPGKVAFEEQQWHHDDGSIDPMTIISQFNRLDVTHVSLCMADVSDQIFQALLQLIAAKPKLQRLDWKMGLKSTSHLKDFFSVLEAHRTLSTLILDYYSPELDPDYSMLIRMLSRNRNIEVRRNYSCGEWYDEFMDTPGSEIVVLNRFYRGSASLGQEPQLIRLKLVGKSLVESASSNFQRSALLLADHADALCQLLHDGSALDPEIEENTLQAPAQNEDRKRKTKHHSQRAAKKVRHRRP